MKVFHDIGNFEIHVAFIKIYLVVNINLDSLDHGQAQQDVGPDLYSSCFDTLI